MKSKKFHVNNLGAFVFFAVIVILIIGLFVYFLFRFNKMDNNKYVVRSGSVFYSDNYKFLKSEGETFISARLDGNYYWYDNKEKKSSRENIGPNPVIYNSSDYKINLYGNAYQVMSSGEVLSLSGLTEITKASPTKFYKLKDRKYLMVDSTLRTSDKSIKTTGYLIIELDRQGNATFANHEINIKTIKPLILKGTTMNFDIANEKLIYGKKEINLKNIIGSTNDYKEENPKTSISENGDNFDGGGNSSSSSSFSSSESYYDEYVRDVIYSVNNLTKSVTDVNDKTDLSVKKDEIYYDFSKYIALKNVSSTVSSISTDYVVVDSNNEYQYVFLRIDDNAGYSNTYYLNKNETNYIIRDLSVDKTYTLSFGYKLVGASEEVVEDIVNVKTKAPSCYVNILKLSSSILTYNVKIGMEYQFTSGDIYLYTDGTFSSSDSVDMAKAASNGGFTGTLSFSRLGNINTLRLENIMYNGSNVNIDCSYRFVS